ncbi:MAG TPA: prolyl oligopeptidase family serine peptidase [Parafilimonas sp.]|nr:prolyl oligopeptidase family serine peptidase [Parafilimonas sp.]
MKIEKKRKVMLLISSIFIFVAAHTQEPTIPVADNLVTDGIPPLPASIVPEVKSYTESRGAVVVDWHPLKKEMLISTRFGNTPQLHWVKMPGGERKQITFFDEPVSTATFNPVNANYFLYAKDSGGNEFRQIYRYQISTGKSIQLTPGGRSQNGNIAWNEKGNKIVYTSTRRNGADRDIYMMDPLDTSTNKMLMQVSGGGWSIDDWSDDEKKLIVEEEISVNESSLWIYDFNTGDKKRLLPQQDERAVYSNGIFSKDGKGIYLLSNKDNEFLKLCWYDLSSNKLTVLTPEINWDVTNIDVTKDGKQIAFVTNEAGASKLYIMNTSSKKYMRVDAVPTGVIGGITWHKDGSSLAFSYISSNASSDVFEWNTERQNLTRWTESELGGMDVSGIEPPELIKWKSFDGKEISGFLYKANKKFTGRRPVIINIHGGPEGQSRPTFIGRSNYFLNELGVSIIYPNVRGSTGYGKTFTDLDNGMKREESVQDIGSLIDWIATQSNLDASRIMITGGSYGGYMTLACAFHYNDKIRCALDVVGISNFNTFLKNTESYRRDLRRVEYGDERDTAMAAFFERTAPLNNVDKITKPMFIVQGKNDPRVPYTESQNMAEKIKKNGGAVWYLMANDEGHGFGKKNNQDFLFYAMVEFVKRYLVND